MRACIPPVLVLAALLGAAMVNCAALRREAARWAEPLPAAEALADAGDWDGAANALEESRRLWRGHQTWLRVTTAHSALNAVDLTYLRAFAFARGEEEAEFRAALAELRGQFRILTELERVSLGNVF